MPGPGDRRLRDNVEIEDHRLDRDPHPHLRAEINARFLVIEEVLGIGGEGGEEPASAVTIGTGLPQPIGDQPAYAGASTTEAAAVDHVHALQLPGTVLQLPESAEGGTGVVMRTANGETTVTESPVLEGSLTAEAVTMTSLTAATVRLAVVGEDGTVDVIATGTWDGTTLDLDGPLRANSLRVDGMAGTGERLVLAGADGTQRAEPVWSWNPANRSSAISDSADNVAVGYTATNTSANASNVRASFQAKNGTSTLWMEMCGTGNNQTLLGLSRANAGNILWDGVSRFFIGSFAGTAPCYFAIGGTEEARMQTSGWTFRQAVKETALAGTGQRMMTAAASDGAHAAVSQVTWTGSWLQISGADVAAVNANGIVARTAAGTFAARSLTAPAAGLTITNPAGTAGNPTFALANDLAAVEGLASTGIAVRTGADAWAQRAVAVTAGHLTVANGDGVAGNPTLGLPAVGPGAGSVGSASQTLTVSTDDQGRVTARSAQAIAITPAQAGADPAGTAASTMSAHTGAGDPHTQYRLESASVPWGEVSGVDVTYAQMQQVSAASRLLGSGSTAGAQDVREITLGTGLSMSGDTLNCTVAGGGTVSSVGLSAPAQFSVSGSPVTGSGTLTFSWASQSANMVLAAPNGSTGAPTFRSLVAADLPSDAMQARYQANPCDFNTLVLPGTYRFSDSLTNSPGVGGYGNVAVFRTPGNDTIAQVAFGYNTEYLRFRVGNPAEAGGGGSWRAWQTIWNSGYQGSGTGMDADLLDGMHRDVAANGNTVVSRDASGHTNANYSFANYFNSGDDVSAGTLTYLMGKFGDNYHRSATPAKVKTFLAYTGAEIDAPGTDHSKAIGTAWQMPWKYYGNGHTVTDNSNGALGASNVNPDYPWAAAVCPTLMGWNGANTYGVRVDSARYADNLGGQPSSYFTNGANLQAGTVTNAKLAAMAAATLKGRKTGAGDPQDLTPDDAWSILLPSFYGKFQNKTGVSYSAAFTATADMFHVISGASGSFTVTLPSVSSNIGAVIGFVVSDTNAYTMEFTLDAGASVSICGRTRYLKLIRGNVVMIYSDGTRWLPLVLCLDTPWVVEDDPDIIRAVTTNPTRGSTREAKRSWCRHGGVCCERFHYAQTAAGTAGSGAYYFLTRFTMSEGYAFGTGVAENQSVGCGRVHASTNYKPVMALVHDSNRNAVLLQATDESDSAIVSSGHFPLNNTNSKFSYDIVYPVADW